MKTSVTNKQAHQTAVSCGGPSTVPAGRDMRKLTITHEGILYRNPLPGYRAECAYLPNIVPLSEKELLCFYRVGQAFYSDDGRIAQLRSSDGGRIWQAEGLVWDPRHDAMPFGYGSPHGARLADGTLLLVAKRYNNSEPGRLMYNPATGGMRTSEQVLFRSTDAGRTWSSPEVLPLPGDGMADAPSSVIELSDGRLFLGCETWKSWDDPAPLHIKCFALFSDDGGHTWGQRVDFPSAMDAKRMYSHSRYSRTLDGRICVLQWTQEVGTSKDLDLHFTISDTSGTKWSLPRSTGLMGQTSWVAHLGGEMYAAAYTHRTGMKPGISVVLSHDGGAHWDVERQALVWDAVGQEYLGVQHRPAYPSSHDNIAFGKPNLVRVPDGTLICAWWCTQACVTHARFACLRVA